jgi:hypothetical protein
LLREKSNIGQVLVLVPPFKGRENRKQEYPAQDKNRRQQAGKNPGPQEETQASPEQPFFLPKLEAFRSREKHRRIIAPCPFRGRQRALCGPLPKVGQQPYDFVEVFDGLTRDLEKTLARRYHQ